jgi:hypothetical protein
MGPQYPYPENERTNEIETEGLAMAVDWEVVRSLGPYAQAGATLIASGIAGAVAWKALSTWKRQHQFDLARKLLLEIADFKSRLHLLRSPDYASCADDIDSFKGQTGKICRLISEGFPLWGKQLDQISTEIFQLTFNVAHSWHIVRNHADKAPPPNAVEAKELAELLEYHLTVAQKASPYDESDWASLRYKDALEKLESFLLKRTRV